jgi:hypothetical protein
MPDVNPRIHTGGQQNASDRKGTGLKANDLSKRGKSYKFLKRIAGFCITFSRLTD